MPLSKVRNRERMRVIRGLGVKAVLSSSDVRALRKAGIDPEGIGEERGKVSSRVFYALLREKEAVSAHLSWHHESVKYPDIVTILEKLREEMDGQAVLIRLLQVQIKEQSNLIRSLIEMGVTGGY